MAERHDDLETTLRDVGAHLSYPRTADLLPAVRARIESHETHGSLVDLLRSPLRLAPAVATLALLVVATLAFQPVAGEAAEALGLRGIGIFRVPAVPDVPPGDLIPADAERVASVEAASRLVGFTVRVPERIGPGEGGSVVGGPDAVYVRRADGSAMALLYYGESSGIPISICCAARLLVIEARGGLEAQLLAKGIGPETTVQELEVNGGPGVWIEGAPHQVFFRAPNGDILIDTVRLAGNVLLWEQDGLLMRIEAQISRDQALRIARSMR